MEIFEILIKFGEITVKIFLYVNCKILGYSQFFGAEIKYPFDGQYTLFGGRALCKFFL